MSGASPSDTESESESDFEVKTEAETAAEAHRRRTIIRLLVGVGIGVPILIELATFVGLVEQSLFGDGGDSDSAGGTSTATEPASGVGVGDELLPETPQRETLSVASYRAGDNRWILTLSATVENTTSTPYTMQFGSVTTDGGRRVEGAHRAVTVAAGGTEQVTGTWQLPAGSRPDSVTLRTGESDTVTTEHQVDLARIPVEGN